MEQWFNQDDFEVQEKLRRARAKFKTQEDRELKEFALFFKEWLARRASKSAAKMFQMLKVKHIRETLPLLQDTNEVITNSMEENKTWVM